MPREQRMITRDDLMSLEDYELIRKDKKQEGLLRKKYTRLAIGPHAMLTFESWDSMWLQVQEMLSIEKGGEAQIADELEAYNPMVPNGSELTATLMFEIEDPIRRDRFLRTIGGVEEHVFLVRTSAEGKASAVQFLHFPMDETHLTAWHDTNSQAMVEINHPNYGHAALINADTRNFLTRNCF